MPPNIDANVITAVATVILTLITGGYVVITHKLLKHSEGSSRRAERIAFHPTVFPDLVIEEGAPQLVPRAESS